MSLLFNILSRFVVAFLPRSNHLISWLQSPSAVILERKKRKSVTTSICHEVMGPGSSAILQCRRPQFNSWIGKTPGGGIGYPLQYSCASLVSQTVKNLPAVRDLCLISGLERSPGGGLGNLLQYSCLEKPKDRGAWGLWPMGPQGVGHNWETKHNTVGPDAMILVFLIFSFKLSLSLSFFTLIRKLFSSSSHSDIRMVSSAYLRLLDVSATYLDSSL